VNELKEKPISDVPVVVLDTETTGLHPYLGHRVVEIGAVRLETNSEGPWQVTAEFNQLLQPGRRMDPGASRINGIYDEELINAPPFGNVASELLRMLDGAVLVAHNAQFDAGFLGIELYIRSLAKPGKHESTLSNPWICTLQLARRHFYFGRNSLSHIAKRLGIRFGRAHRALNDVYVTAEVFKRMVRELNRDRFFSVGDFLHAQGGAIFTPPPPQVSLAQPLNEALIEGKAL